MAFIDDFFEDTAFRLTQEKRVEAMQLRVAQRYAQAWGVLGLGQRALKDSVLGGRSLITTLWPATLSEEDLMARVCPCEIEAVSPWIDYEDTERGILPLR